MAKKVPVTEVLVLPEESLTFSDKTPIEAFLRGLTPFFRTAQDLELASRQALERAQAIKPPQTAQDDEAIQVEIKSNTAGRKALTGHWSAVASLFHGVHRRITSARSRGEGNYDTANARIQRFHNDFVAEARRKAAQEQERLRRENERKAQAEREAELQRLEDEAVKAEAASADLSEREAMFVELVAEGRNHPSGAANFAGFKNPELTAERLMKIPKIVAAIAAKQEAKRIRDQRQAVAESPVVVRHEEVKADVRRAAGASDRTFHHGDILDGPAFIAAHRRDATVPDDAFLVNPRWVTEQASALREQLNRYVGLRYHTTTKTI